MSVVVARFMAHLVVAGCTLMALFFVGAVFVRLYKLAFGCKEDSPKKNPGKEFSFAIQGQDLSHLVKLPSQRVFPKANRPVAANVRKEGHLSQDWSPVLSQEELNSLRIPTFIRKPRQAQVLPCVEASQLTQPEVQEPVPNPVHVSTEDNLFVTKNIFKLDPVAAH